MKWVHAADLHLDSPLRGLERYEGAPSARVRDATRAAFRSVIDVCLNERARFLLLAGDVFDGDWKDVNTGLFFLAQLGRLADARCDVLLVRGNHDFEITHALTYPSHVHAFDPPGGRNELPFEADGVVFHGASYRQQRESESLLPAYAPPRKGLLNVGLLHTHVSGSTGHARYAPCSLEELVAHGYDYWALGHIHSRAVLSESPFVVYPGNTQGRHAGEKGDKGCVVVEVEASRIARVRFAPTSVMTWVEAIVDASPDDELDDLFGKTRAKIDEVAAASLGKLVALRLEVRGACRAHTKASLDPRRFAAEVRGQAIGRGLDVWIEKVRLATSPHEGSDLGTESGLVGEALAALARLRADEAESNVVFKRLVQPLVARLGVAELAEDPELRARVVSQAEALIADRLLRTREES